MIGRAIRTPSWFCRLSLLVAVLLLLPGSARAQDARLAGRYAVAGTFSCLYALSGFASNGVPNNLATASASSFSSSGIMNFDGAGHATGIFRLVGLDQPPNPAADTQSITARFHYAVGNNGGVLVKGTNLSGQFLSPGPAAGVSYTIDQIQLHGWLAANNQGLTLTTVQSNVMNVIYANGVTVPEVCGISEVLLQISQ